MTADSSMQGAAQANPSQQAQQAEEPQGQPLAGQDGAATPASTEDTIQAMLDAAGEAIDRRSPGLGQPGHGQQAQPGQEPPAPSGEEPGQQPAPPKKTQLKINGQEVELTQEEIHALASMGADYTRKTQELADQRRQVEAYRGLIDMIQRDQGFARHVFGYQGQGSQAQAGQSPPADPLERIKWEATREARQAVMQELAPVLSRVPQLEAQSEVTALMAQLGQDPLRGQVMQGMQQYVQSQPPLLRAKIMRELDSSVPDFMDVYTAVRGHIVAAQAQPAAQAPAAPQGQPLRVVQKAKPPQLETPGVGAPPADPKMQDLKTLTKRVRSGSAKPEDLGDLLRLSGAFDRMTGGPR